MTKRALLIGGAAILVALPVTYFAYAATLGVSSSKVTIYKSDASIAVPSPTPSATGSASPSAPSLTGSCTLFPTQDAYVNEAAPTTGYGSVDLAVRSDKSANKRTFLMFDPSACVIPSGATLKTATINLTFSAATTAARGWIVHRVAGPWTESTTWATQPAPGALLGPISIPRGSTSISGPLTADVVSMRANPATNFGWRIIDDTEGATKSFEIGIRSREASSGRPTLVINYSP